MSGLDLSAAEAAVSGAFGGHLPTGAALLANSATLVTVPTIRPRYTVTDVGDIAEMLDVAAHRWPDEPRRKELLVRLAGVGRDAVSQELAAADSSRRRERQRDAVGKIRELVDPESLLDDAAWR